MYNPKSSTGISFTRRSLLAKIASVTAGLTFFPEGINRSYARFQPDIKRAGQTGRDGFVKDGFLGEDFLLHSKIAKILYHQFAKSLPIIDYHCHLPPGEIATNKQFDNLTKIWLEGDHYKMRMMRANGVDEKFITGNATDEDKFLKWAETVPYMLRSPLYHWTHLELKRYFGIDKLLDGSTAKEIYEQVNMLLRTDTYKPEFDNYLE
jgi:glucuronate isomerase